MAKLQPTNHGNDKRNVTRVWSHKSVTVLTRVWCHNPATKVAWHNTANMLWHHDLATMETSHHDNEVWHTLMCDPHAVLCNLDYRLLNEW
jgi:hypothetical protein